MRVATWNTNHWQRQHDPDRWATVRGQLEKADVAVALLQETGPTVGENGIYKPLSRLRSGADYGSAIVAIDPDVHIEAFELEDADGPVS